MRVNRRIKVLCINTYIFLVVYIEEILRKYILKIDPEYLPVSRSKPCTCDRP